MLIEESKTGLLDRDVVVVVEVVEPHDAIPASEAVRRVEADEACCAGYEGLFLASIALRLVLQSRCLRSADVHVQAEVVAEDPRYAGLLDTVYAFELVVAVNLQPVASKKQESVPTTCEKRRLLIGYT